MFATPAYAQAAGGAAAGGPACEMLIQFLPLVGLVVLFYFLMIRPQQRRMKAHQAMLAALKRGDTVVLSSGVHRQGRPRRGRRGRRRDRHRRHRQGAQGMIAEVRTRGAPAPANDSKA